MIENEKGLFLSEVTMLTNWILINYPKPYTFNSDMVYENCPTSFSDEAIANFLKLCQNQGLIVLDDEDMENYRVN